MAGQGDATASEGDHPPKRTHSLATIAVHGGERSGRASVADSVTVPLVMTATYAFRNTAHLIDFEEGRAQSFEYGRLGNPTVVSLEQKISDSVTARRNKHIDDTKYDELEGAESTLVSASGMNAATTMLLALVPQNGHIVTTTDCYFGTRQFIQKVLPKMGITNTVLDPADIDGLEEALKKQEVTLFFSESPTNPCLRCIDIERVASLCHAHGAIVCVDCTFATPINQQAIRLGADLVLHSATKYMAGHHDVLAGSLSGRQELVAQVRELHHIMGGVVDPHAAWLVLRGLKTLDLRVKRHNDSALRLALELEAHPKVARVHYPGLKSHPEHEVAAKQMKGGFGGVVSFEIDGDLKRTSDFIDNLKIPYIAPSLGGVESLVEQPAVISYWHLGSAAREKMGIKDNLVRLSVGIEGYEDILEDLMQALDNI